MSAARESDGLPATERGALAASPPALDGNQLLADLPAAEADALAAAAERVRPRMRELIYSQDGPITHAYFPTGAVFSLLAQTADGAIVETLAVGREGMVGLPAVLGRGRSHTRVVCQVSGLAVRVPVAALAAAAPPGGVLHGRLTRYAVARLASLSRSVACSRLHTAQQRYARWVLTMQDRVGTDEFPITQEFLAHMLGVTRPTISLVGQELQAAGLVHGEHGRLTVDDRAGLEAVACECYAAVRRAFDELAEEIGR